jgi:hypothetical protein
LLFQYFNLNLFELKNNVRLFKPHSGNFPQLTAKRFAGIIAVSRVLCRKTGRFAFQPLVGFFFAVGFVGDIFID